ncbi:MAG TPA: pilus assembly protein N-terminal domain-containing protein, partial [Isosphaeraceae bacterium]
MERAGFRANPQGSAPGTIRDPGLIRADARDEPEAMRPLSPGARRKVEALIEPETGAEVAMQVAVNRSRLLRTKRDLFRTVIGDPGVLDVAQFSPRELSIIGKQVGSSPLTLWFDGPEAGQTLTYLVTVVPDEAARARRLATVRDLEDQIGRLFPESRIRLLVVGDRLIVRGQARDVKEANQVLEIVRGQRQALALTPGQDDATPPTGPEDDAPPGPSEPAGAIGAPAVDSIGAPPIGPVGPTANALTPPGTAAAGAPESAAVTAPTRDIINMIEVPGETQVMLKVRIAELRRAAVRRIGADLNINTSGDLGSFFFTSALAGGTNPVAIFDDGDVRIAISALTANNAMKILAEPNLVTLSGRPASFLSGGSFAVPTVVGLGGVGAATTNFQGFGTQLFFIPTVLDKDRIRLQVTPSLSAINRDNTVNGIPGLTVNTAFTTVDLRAGQWLAIAGLLSDQQSGSNNRVPGLGDLPGLKLLFGNTSVTREESELIVLVSPVLIHPLEPCQAPPLLPGMEVTEPDDVDLFLKGRWEGRPEIQHRSTVAPILRQRAADTRPRPASVPGAGPGPAAPARPPEAYFLRGPRGFSR